METFSLDYALCTCLLLFALGCGVWFYFFCRAQRIKKVLQTLGSAAEVYAGILRQEKALMDPYIRLRIDFQDAVTHHLCLILSYRLSRRLNGPKLNRKKTKLRLIKSRCCLTAFG